MYDIFKSRRTKIEVVTLVMALALTGAWFRSLNKVDKFSLGSDTFTYSGFASFQSSVAWLHVTPVDRSHWAADSGESTELFHELAEAIIDMSIGQLLVNENGFRWKFHACGIDIGERELSTVHVEFWKLSYWFYITPLNLISAYLLLSKGKRSNQSVTSGQFTAAKPATTRESDQDHSIHARGSL